MRWTQTPIKHLTLFSNKSIFSLMTYICSQSRATPLLLDV